MGPGWQPERIRLATEADIANAPDFAQAWLQKERDREELRLLDQRDPMVRTKTLQGVASLRKAGINRISDLARFTDKELLSLKGVGKTSVDQWREQAAKLAEVQS
jgi:DNA-directed RNA polymerase alpha subunit